MINKLFILFYFILLALPEEDKIGCRGKEERMCLGEGSN